MNDLTLLFGFWAAFSLALVSPGPNFAVILGTSLERGRRAAVWTALGMVVGELAWGLAAVFGIAALAAQQPWIATALAWGGGSVLLLLAALSLRSALRPTPPMAEAAAAPSVPLAGRGSFLRGLGLMLLNPKAGVFWVSLTGVFLAAGDTTTLGLVAIAGACLLSLLWHLSLAYAFTTRVAVALYRRVRRGLEAVLGLVLAALGLRLIVAQ